MRNAAVLSRERWVELHCMKSANLDTQQAYQWLPCRTLPTRNPSQYKDRLSRYKDSHYTIWRWLPCRTVPTCTTSSSMPAATIRNPAHLYNIKQHASGCHTEPCPPIRHQAACQWLPYRTLPTYTTSSSMPAATIRNPAHLYDIKQHASGCHTEPCLPVRHQAACPVATEPNPA